MNICLNLPDSKRKQIWQQYKAVNPKKVIRPLVLIQFPNGQPETIKAVEEKLADMGYTYENGLAAKWMADDKKNLSDDFTHNDGIPVFLLMKQAVSTGWDCPRAKILVKLREGMSENFEVQTIGRIRRMPEAKHYENDALDFCYVYTFDEKYKEGLLSDMDRAYETRRLFLKNKCKTFTLEKQMRDLEFDGLGERDILAMLHQHLVVKYKLENDKAQNQLILQSHGYIFGNDIVNQVLYGKFTEIANLTDKHNLNSENYHTTRQKVDTHKNGIQLLHSVDSIKTAIGIPTAKVKVILERLFRKSKKRKYKLIELTTQEFYAFVINNAHKLRLEFREITANVDIQTEFARNPKVSDFHIPEQDFFKYDPGVKSEVEYLSNAYNDYTSGFATSLVRSTSEMLFEQYCETRDDIDWVYKNGDTGQQYFSIVYVDGIQHQWLFYADYIVMKKDGTVWVIETKGGESHGQDKNIDRQIENKFNAFKNYAEKHNLNWGFVRDKDNQLYINNTVFVEDMADSEWKPLSDLF
jgi:type III restriction enzyme